MSALTDFAAHARKMAAAEHKPECPSLGPPSTPVWHGIYEGDDDFPVALGLSGFTPPPPKCDGCNPQRDRDLFARLADEVDAYLHRDEAPDLFGEWAVEPVAVEPEAVEHG